MDHASGWYKRNTQRILILIAIVLCTFNNVDTVSLVGHLSSNSAMRDAAMKEASAFLDASQASPPNPAPMPSGGQNPTADNDLLALKYQSALDATKLPLWWTKAEWNKVWSAVKDLKEKAETSTGIALPPSPAAGGSAPAPAPRYEVNYAWILAKLTGLLISIMAVSMGASLLVRHPQQARQCSPGRQAPRPDRRQPCPRSRPRAAR